MLRSLVIFVFCIFTSASARAGSLEITIENPELAKGQLMIQILAGEAGFRGEQPAFAAVQQKVAGGPVTVILKDVPDGEYGVRVMHDVNGNGKLDSNFIGMPTEPWAFSNNAAGHMGPPKWPDVKFLVSGDVKQSIRLNH